VEILIIVFHVLLSLGLIALVLMQHGKGADAGAAFGSGASATVFGARGSGNFLSRATAVLATLFFVTSIVMAGIAINRNKEEGLITKEAAEAVAPAPAPAAPEQPTTDLPPLAEAPPATGEGASGDMPPMAESAMSAPPSVESEQPTLDVPATTEPAPAIDAPGADGKSN